MSWRSVARATLLLAVEGEVGAVEGKEAEGQEGGPGEGVSEWRQVERGEDVVPCAAETEEERVRSGKPTLVFIRAQEEW